VKTKGLHAKIAVSADGTGIVSADGTGIVSRADGVLLMQTLQVCGLGLGR